MSDSMVQRVIEEVQERENAVLRCVTPSGEKVDFAYVPITGGNGIWIRGESVTMESRTVRPATVENFARRCDPDNEIFESDEYRSLDGRTDVELTTYADSVFPHLEPGP